MKYLSIRVSEKARIGTIYFFSLFVIIIFCQAATAQSGETILSIEVDLSTDPDSAFIQVSALPGYAGKIEITSLQDENNTQRVELYYHYCFPQAIFMIYDTSFAIEAEYPYDLLILTFLDTTSYSNEPPVCVFQNDSVIPVDTLLLTADQIVFTESIENESDHVNIYPNPTTGSVYIQIPETVKIHSIRLMDLLGRNIHVWEGHHKSIPLDSQPSGQYFLVFDTNKGLMTHRIIRE